MKTVKEVAEITGVSIRTLRYYDEIGLLKPTQLTDAGYRLYDNKALEKLQEIMFFKELEIPLETIKQIMENRNLDRQEILIMQKALLEKKRNRLNGIIELIDDVMKGVNTMSFEAFSDEDIEKIVEHTIGQLRQEDLNNLIDKYGSVEAVRAELTENLRDESTEANLIKLYGSKEKAVEVSLSGMNGMENLEKYQKETDEIYKQFATAMNTNDSVLKENAVKRLGENNKAMLQLENVRYFLLQLADEILKTPLLAEATDKQYGEGVAEYIANSIKEYYGVS